MWPTKDVSSDSLRCVCLIKRIENPGREMPRSEPRQYERCGGKDKQRDDA